MSKKKSSKDVSGKGLTKAQIQGVALVLQDSIKVKKDDILKDMENELSQDITIVRSEAKTLIKQKILENSDNVIHQCTRKFCELYESCNVGQFKDRYALLQIRWNEWIKDCLICETSENILMIPPNISQRSGNTEPCISTQFESSGVSGVLHAICAAFFHCASKVVKSVKPGKRNEPVPPKLDADSLDSLLAFSGACMHLVCKKSCGQTKFLIKQLKMTKSMKCAYREYGVLSPGMELLPTIPVRSLNPYLTFLNGCIQESCTECALKLYGSDFIKVTSLYITYITK